MLTVYKILVNIAYAILLPYFRSKRSKAPIEWSDRMVLESAGRPDADPIYASRGSGRDGFCHFHASSVGEVRVLRRLIDAVKKIRPDIRYSVSTYTRAGHNLAGELFDDAASVFYFPLDCHFPLRRFFKSYRPHGIVIVETEIWPYFLDYCRKHDFPLVQANGRISAGSTKWYRLLRPTLRRLFSGYRAFLMQTDADRDRIIKIGADPDRVRALGNIKYDIDPTVDIEKQRADIRIRLGLPDGTCLLIAASTRPGEEDILCRALRGVSAFPDGMTAMIAPRHLDRLDEVKHVLSKHGHSFALYSDLEDGVPPPTGVILMDRIGLLAELFYGADLAFVGGTLAELGGHNIMEPVLAGVPVLFGPSVYNVQQASEEIIDRNLGRLVHDAGEMADCINGYLRAEIRFDTIEAGASSVAEESAGIIVRELGL